MKKDKPYDPMRQKKQNIPAKYGVGKYGGSRVGASRPGKRGR